MKGFYFVVLYAIMIAFAFSIGVFSNVAKVQQIEDLKDFNCKSQEMSLLNLTANDFLYGIYNHEGYYCVWTKGLSDEEIANTKEHEITHNLVKNNISHYCKRYTGVLCG